MELEIKNVTKSFKTKTAVNRFSMEIQSGECVALAGPNGAGKSTLIKLIADIMNPDQGEVLLNGKKVSKMKKEIGYLPQYTNFFPWMTANETLNFMGRLSNVGKRDLEREIPRVLSKVGLGKEENTRVGTFSGGMKQRLGIAQALLHKPSLILMDEPVSSLDPIGRREVLNIINEIKEETTILLSTHILGDAEEVCERFVIIKDGKKIEDATIIDLLKRNNKDKLYFEITEKVKDWVREIGTFDYVKNVDLTGNRVKVEVDNVGLNKDMLLENALENNVNLVKFEIGSESLEELFLKLVVGK
ncbi:MAG TPA: ABC transporter ATP-binding protein [Bacillota bacterium]|nr:ABC transporter ATP-binding protein [Bacillota bacterium]